MIPKNGQMLDRAKELRKNMTPQERKLWYDFLRSYPIKIYKQRIIESFIVDFYCHAAKLVIEVDGSHHYDSDGMAYDQERTSVLQNYGLQVIRFSNSDISRNFSGVCQRIHEVIQSRLGHE